MLLTITNTRAPATDLGYLLHKNPARVHHAGLSFGDAHVFYPEASQERCTVALMLTVDPVELVRGRPGAAPKERKLEDYVNDRPYVASSFLSVAMAKMFGTALAGRSKEREELTTRSLPLEAALPAVPARASSKGSSFRSAMLSNPTPCLPIRTFPNGAAPAVGRCGCARTSPSMICSAIYMSCYRC